VVVGTPRGRAAVWRNISRRLAPKAGFQRGSEQQGGSCWLPTHPAQRSQCPASPRVTPGHLLSLGSRAGTRNGSEDSFVSPLPAPPAEGRSGNELCSHGLATEMKRRVHSSTRTAFPEGTEQQNGVLQAWRAFFPLIFAKLQLFQRPPPR